MKVSYIIYALGIVLLSCSQTPPENRSDDEGLNNKRIITNAFEQWQNGMANFFDLLDENVEWTVTGSGFFSGTYTGKQHFIQEAVVPINNQLSTSITPELIEITAEENIVWLHWTGTATTKTGAIYKNEYAWKLELKNKKIVKAVAFLDAIELDNLFQKNQKMNSTIEETKEYIGMWVTEDGYIRHHLLSNNRYDEARGDRESAYQGDYKVTGNHIDYEDDTGFTADGEFKDGILYHAGMVLYKENE